MKTNKGEEGGQGAQGWGEGVVLYRWAGKAFLI